MRSSGHEVYPLILCQNWVRRPGRQLSSDNKSLQSGDSEGRTIRIKTHKLYCKNPPKPSLQKNGERQELSYQDRYSVESVQHNVG